VHTPRLRTAIATLLMTALPMVVAAQAPTPPPATPPPAPAPAPAPNPADTPNIRIGATIYADYTFVQSPEITDADGNTVHSNAFNVGRSYINITGNLSRIVNFRITPDISRETGTGSSLNGSLVFRIKYAFMQFNLDDWMTKGSWARFGIQQTPLLDYEEGIYRYRFQGTTFTEREGFYNSADGGASFHMNFPSNYGEVHVGFYNGEGYARPEVNDQKAVELRGTVRPFARNALILRGLRVTGFVFADNYIKDAERTRAVGQVTFESRYLNAGFDGIKAHDQPSIRNADVEASGWSWWATPKLPFESTASVEALLRYDHLQPNALVPADRTRTIAGVAYWFKNQGSYQSALLLDYDGQTFHNFAPAQPKQTRVAVHALINF